MIREPRCFRRRCRHLVGVKQDAGREFGERCVCVAFPDGIPDEIAYGREDHLQPWPGQGNDVVYEPDTEI